MLYQVNELRLKRHPQKISILIYHLILPQKQDRAPNLLISHDSSLEWFKLAFR